MSRAFPLPTREAVLANGFPEGLIDHYRQQAHVERARAIGSFLVRVLRRLRRSGWTSVGCLRTGTA